MISRRHLAAAAPAALALPGLARAAGRAPLRLAMPMEIVDGMTVVTLLINGKGPYRMVVSPSVSLNQVADDLVPELGMREVDNTMKNIGEAGVSPTKAYQAANIFIGGRIHQDNVSFAAAPRLADKIDGALCPWFAGFSACFDFANREFVVLQGAPPTEGFTAVPFVGRQPRAMTSFRQHPSFIHYRSEVRLAGTVDGQPVTLSVDTVTSASLLLSSDFVRAHGLWERYPKGEPITFHEGGALIDAHRVRLGSLKLGELDVAEPDVILLHGQGMRRGDSDTDGNIGTGLIRRYVTWIDWQAGYAYFKLSPTAAV